MRALTIAIAMLLGACASSPTRWAHGSKGQQEFYQDNSQCLSMSGAGQAQPMVLGAGPVATGYNQGAAMRASSNQRLIYEQCMLGNGWRQVP
jgi:hypothetical protein